MMWNGFSVSLFAAVFVPLITRTIKDTSLTNEKSNSMAMTAMIAIGVGEAIGGIFHGQLHDRLGTKRFVMCYIVEILIAVGLLISYNEVDTYNLAHAMAFTFMWGMQDSGVEVFTRIICGF